MIGYLIMKQILVLSTTVHIFLIYSKPEAFASIKSLSGFSKPAGHSVILKPDCAREGDSLFNCVSP